MLMDNIVERFAERAPITVMARLALQRALDPAWVDQVFDQHRQRQYQRDLLFSSVVEIMSVVAVGLRPSVHAAAKRYLALPVSMTALYDKINHTDPAVVRALVQGSHARLGAILQHLGPAPAPSVPGYRLRIVDGNHLPASEKRLKPLRTFRGAALPGHSLVVYDPDSNLVVDLLPCEDAHAQERACMGPILAQAGPGELWIADRNFSTRTILTGWHARGSTFIVREHARTPSPVVASALQATGCCDTGNLFEQQVCIDAGDGRSLPLRRIVLELDHPTTDGETHLRLLSNLPSAQFDANSIAQLYRRRWRIENMFQRLEAALRSEIATLGHPRAALLAFGMAVLAYNILALIEGTISLCHRLHETDIILSTFYLALEVKGAYEGMMIAIERAAWEPCDRLDSAELAALLLRIAAHVQPARLRKSTRGPKTPKKTAYVSGAEARRHVATARVLKSGRVDRPRP